MLPHQRSAKGQEARAAPSSQNNGPGGPCSLRLQASDACMRALITGEGTRMGSVIGQSARLSRAISKEVRHTFGRFSSYYSSFIDFNLR